MEGKKKRTNVQIDIGIDPSKLADVPAKTVEHVIGQIICRFTHHQYDRLTILSEGSNNLYCQFWDEGKIKMTMGAIWRKETQTFTFHT